MRRSKVLSLAGLKSVIDTFSKESENHKLNQNDKSVNKVQFMNCTALKEKDEGVYSNKPPEG